MPDRPDFFPLGPLRHGTTISITVVTIMATWLFAELSQSQFKARSGPRYGVSKSVATFHDLQQAATSYIRILKGLYKSLNPKKKTFTFTTDKLSDNLRQSSDNEFLSQTACESSAFEVLHRIILVAQDPELFVRPDPELFVSYWTTH